MIGGDPYNNADTVKLGPAQVSMLANAMVQLRVILGNVQNGSDTTVTISQDDATRTWVVKVGKKTYYGASLYDAIKSAHSAD